MRVIAMGAVLLISLAVRADEASLEQLRKRVEVLGKEISGHTELLQWQEEQGEAELAADTRTKLLALIEEQREALGLLEERVRGAPSAEATKAAGPIDLALDWLVLHQEPDGSWKPVLHWKRSGTEKIDGLGHQDYVVGVTALALLAFLEDGHTYRKGDHRKAVQQGFEFLKKAQDPEGCFGDRKVKHFIYGHAIATLAMVRHYDRTRSSVYKRSAEAAVRFIEAARNPDSAWRYGVRPGDNDSSVTAWAATALAAARTAGLRVDDAAFRGARSFIDAVTDPKSGHVGYDRLGSGPARPAEMVGRFPSHRSEANTAQGTLVRILAGVDPEESVLFRKGVDRIKALPPIWDPRTGTIDMYYWFWGTLAMSRIGGEGWTDWRSKLALIVEEHQEKEGRTQGSFEPVGPWGPDGGRIYSTAIMTLIATTVRNGDSWFSRRAD